MSSLYEKSGTDAQGSRAGRSARPPWTERLRALAVRDVLDERALGRGVVQQAEVREQPDFIARLGRGLEENVPVDAGQSRADVIQRPDLDQFLGRDDVRLALVAEHMRHHLDLSGRSPVGQGFGTVLVLLLLVRGVVAARAGLFV